MDRALSALCGDCFNLKQHTGGGDETECVVKPPRFSNFVISDIVNCIIPLCESSIATGTDQGELLRYDYARGEIGPKWAGHSKAISQICSYRDGESILSASRDLTARLWLYEKPDVHMEFKDHHKLIVSAIAANKDYGQVCTGSRDNNLALWDATVGTLLRDETIARNLVTDICWVEDTIAQTSEDKSLRLWDARTLSVTQTYVKKQQILTSCDISGNSVITSSGGMNGSGCEITLWDRRGSDSLPVCELHGHTEKVQRVQFVSPNMAISVSSDQSIKLWDLTDQREKASHTLTYRPTTVVEVLSSSSEQWFAVGTFDNGTVMVSYDKFTNTLESG